jgi:hypothetical protein
MANTVDERLAEIRESTEHIEGEDADRLVGEWLGHILWLLEFVETLRNDDEGLREHIRQLEQRLTKKEAGSPEPPKVGYVCGVAWQHKLGVPEMLGPACRLYNSAEELKKQGCVEECGAVEVEITLRRWVIPQNLLSGVSKK